MRPAEVRGLDTGIAARIVTPRGPVDVETRLRGGFNLSNLLGVAAVAELLELPHDALARGVGALEGVPGRFEAVDRGQPFPVIIDYAHTPDSLDNVLRAARELVDGGRLLVVFGCGGDRDRGKRPQMGAVARGLADVAVVTSDNPRSEDPEPDHRRDRGGRRTGARRSWWWRPTGARRSGGPSSGRNGGTSW